MANENASWGEERIGFGISNDRYPCGVVVRKTAVASTLIWPIGVNRRKRKARGSALGFLYRGVGLIVIHTGRGTRRAGSFGDD
jgi:hypothetical protein